MKSIVAFAISLLAAAVSAAPAASLEARQPQPGDNFATVALRDDFSGRYGAGHIPLDGVSYYVPYTFSQTSINVNGNVIASNGELISWQYPGEFHCTISKLTNGQSWILSPEHKFIDMKGSLSGGTASSLNDAEIACFKD